MNIPNKVKVAGLIFDIVLEKGVFTTDNTKAYGTCNHQSIVIKLESEYSEQKQKQTLLHELMHAIDEEYKIGLEEEQVDKIACGLYSMIVDNPEMFNSIQTQANRQA